MLTDAGRNKVLKEARRYARIVLRSIEQVGLKGIGDTGVRLAIAVDEEVGVPLRAAEQFGEMRRRLVRPERAATDTKSRDFWTRKNSGNKCSLRSPWQTDDLPAWFVRTHNATPPNELKTSMSLELENLLRNVIWLLSRPKAKA